MSEIWYERVSIPTYAGRMNGELMYPVGAARCACMLVNPHPYMGGHMNNPLILHLARSLADHGLAVLRFDYSSKPARNGRPVDVAEAMSEFWETGHAPQDPELIANARTAYDWLREQFDQPVVVIGYSFGAYASLAARLEGVAAFVLISPTLTQHSFPSPPQHVPALVIYSDNDFATPRSASEAWLNASKADYRSCCIAGGDHFYLGQENEVAQVCLDFVNEAALSEMAAR